MAYSRPRRSYSRSRGRSAGSSYTRRPYSWRPVSRKRSYGRSAGRAPTLNIVLQTTPASAVSANPFAPVIEAKKGHKAKL